MATERFFYLDNYRAIAIFLVVGIHAMAYINVDPDTYLYLTAVIFPIAVPVFFFVDGYIFSVQICSDKKFVYKEYIQKSAIRLLIPWLIFTLAYFCIRFGLEYQGLLKERILYGEDLKGVLYVIYTSGVTTQMYFLLSLFIVRLITPLLRRLVTVNIFILVAVYSIYSVAFYYFEISHLTGIPFDPVIHAFWGLQFYLLGLIVLRLEKYSKMNSEMIRNYTLLIAGIVVLGLVTSTVQVFVLLVIYLLSKNFLSNSSILTSIGKNTMGIYLLHMPIVLYIIVFLSNKTINNANIQFFFVWISVFIISYVFSILLNKNVLGRVLFGDVSGLARKLSARKGVITR